MDQDLDAVERWVDEWSNAAHDRAALAQRFADKVASATATATGAGGSITVTVNGSGLVTDLRLASNTQNLFPERLAQEILATMRRAQSLLHAAVQSAAQETVGADSPTAQAVLAGYAHRFPFPQAEGGDVRRG